MKSFYGGSFIKREELSEAGIFYPIKLEYYRTWENKDNTLSENIFKYGIEVVKTEYLENRVNIETTQVKWITDEENKIDEILELLKENEVTPITVENVIEDYMKKDIYEKII